MQSINYTCTSNMWGNDDYNQHIHSNLARHTHVLSTHIHFFFPKIFQFGSHAINVSALRAKKYLGVY